MHHVSIRAAIRRECKLQRKSCSSNVPRSTNQGKLVEKNLLYSKDVYLETINWSTGLKD
jgi:hypothetical protein